MLYRRFDGSERRMHVLRRHSEHAFDHCTPEPQGSFVEHISTLSADITACVKSKVTEWMKYQTAVIQALLEISAGKVEILNKIIF